MAILFKIGPKPDQGPLSGPGPVRFGPDPEDFSPVRSGTPGTLVCCLHPHFVDYHACILEKDPTLAFITFVENWQLFVSNETTLV